MLLLVLFFFLSSAVNGERTARLPGNNVCTSFQDYLHIQNNPHCYYDEDLNLGVPDIIDKYSHNLERYTFTTEDGYIISMFRIKRENPKGVILLQHPVTSGPICNLHQGNRSLAFELWHAGYDIWLNAQRGTKYSQTHVNLTVADYEYWNWSFHEIAVYEIPKQVDLIRSKTNNSKIIFFGHSMGTTLGLIYSSLFPEHAKEAIQVFIYAGVTCYYTHNRSPVIFIAQNVNSIQRIMSSLQIGYLIPLLGPVQNMYRHIFRAYPPFLLFMREVYLFFTGNADESDPETMNLDNMRYLDNTSFKTVFHLLQLMNVKNRFQRYDYGRRKNRAVYGTDRPPVYPLEKITVPTLIMHSQGDILTTPQDAMIVYNQLSEEAKIYGIMALGKLNHMDYYFGLYRKERFTDKLIEFIDKLQK